MSDKYEAQREADRLEKSRLARIASAEMIRIEKIYVADRARREQLANENKERL